MSATANSFRMKKLYWIIAALGVVELVFCLATENLWILRIFLICNIYALYAASWDLLGGYTGQVSLGHALFFGGAAYVSSILNLRLGTPLVLAMGCGILSTVVFAVILGFPSLRVRGPYLSVVTLVTPLVFVAIIFMYPELLGGDCGFTGFANLAGDLKSQFLIVLAVVVPCLLVILAIARSNFGLILKSIRDNESAAEAVGINIARYKIIDFILSGLFAGIAGVLAVHFQGSLSPAMIETTNSILPIMMSLIGGMGTIVGPMIGSYILTFLNEYLVIIPELRIVIYSVVTIFVLRFAPTGLWGWAAERKR